MDKFKWNVLIIIGVLIVVIVGFLISDNQLRSGDTVRTEVTGMRDNNPSKIENSNEGLDFTLWTLDGEEFHLHDLRGKVILINFWATWCPPCRMEIPDLIRLWESHKAEGFDVVAITIQSGKPKDIVKFVEKFNMTYPVLTSENNNDLLRVMDLFGRGAGIRITGVPTTFLIDREGVIREIYVGPRTEAQFWRDIKKYL